MQADIIPPKNANQKERDLAMLCHLLAFCGLFIPFGCIGAPLILWLLKKEDSFTVDRHGREVINFQVSWLIYALISAVLIIIFVGFMLLAILGVSWVILVVMGAVKAQKGELYRYPLTIRFL